MTSSLRRMQMLHSLLTAYPISTSSAVSGTQVYPSPRLPTVRGPILTLTLAAAHGGL